MINYNGSDILHTRAHAPHTRAYEPLAPAALPQEYGRRFDCTQPQDILDEMQKGCVAIKECVCHPQEVNGLNFNNIISSLSFFLESFKILQELFNDL